MAKRPNANDDGGQLNLFSFNQNRYDNDNTDPIRQNGGETLAGVPAEHGRGNGSQGDIGGNASGGGGENGRRNARPDDEVSEAGLDAAAGAQPRLGTGEGEIHPAPARSEPVARNQNNYRISPADGVGTGSLKEKCRANLAAIKIVRNLQAENRPATQEEKSALVRYVGWGGLPQIFSPATDWQAEIRHDATRQYTR